MRRAYWVYPAGTSALTLDGGCRAGRRGPQRGLDIVLIARRLAAIGRNAGNTFPAHQAPHLFRPSRSARIRVVYTLMQGSNMQVAPGGSNAWKRRRP